MKLDATYAGHNGDEISTDIFFGDWCAPNSRLLAFGGGGVGMGSSGGGTSTGGVSWPGPGSSGWTGCGSIAMAVLLNDRGARWASVALVR
jgi:hypothetical protein